MNDNTINDIKQWEIKKIIEIANCLQRKGTSHGSMGEVIAAAFVLNKPEYLPDRYKDMVAAWGRLDYEWREYVITIKDNYMHLIDDDKEQEQT